MKVAINGFGRIGRQILHRIMKSDNDLEVVAINDLTDEHAVKFLTPAVHRPHAGMTHKSIALRVQVGTADEHETLKILQHTTQIVLVYQRRDKYRNPTGRDHAIEVTGGQDQERRAIMCRGSKISIDPDQRLTLHLTLPFRYGVVSGLGHGKSS